MRNIIIILILCCLAILSMAQTYPLSDTAFISYLKATHPNVLTQNNDLKIAEAEIVSGSMVLNNKGIRSLDGIQHFKSIHWLYASNNPLTTLPTLDSLKVARLLHINNCGLTKLPKMDGMVFLNDFEAYENQLTSLSAIEKLPSLKKVTAYKNQLSSFPNFSTAAQLTLLHLGGNPLDSIPPLNAYSNLEGLILWGTGMKNTPNLTTLTKLKTLNLGSNMLTTEPDLSNLKDLENLYIDNNFLKNLPKGIKQLPKLIEANISHNSYSLNDLLELKAITNYSTIFTLMPQKPFPLQAEYTKLTGNNIKLTTDNDSNVEGVTYTLLKNQKVISNNTTGLFEFTNLDLAFSGTYTIQISTPQLPSVYLSSNPIAVTVNPCININDLTITTSKPNCIKKASISIENHTGTALTYTLKNSIDQLKTTSTSTFENLQPGSYSINFSTETCNIDYPSAIIIDQLTCKEFLLSPYEGIKEIQFPQTGDITIYNKQGTKLTTLKGPITWNGEVNDTLLPVGYYFADINNGTDYVLISIIY